MQTATKQLGAGEKLLVHAGHVGVHEPTVAFDIQMLPGFSNILFGGEGVLINNIAWLLRHLPVFAVGGDGNYRIRGIHVDDLAQLCLAAGRAAEDSVWTR